MEEQPFSLSTKALCPFDAMSTHFREMHGRKPVRRKSEAFSEYPSAAQGQEMVQEKHGQPGAVLCTVDPLLTATSFCWGWISQQARAGCVGSSLDPGNGMWRYVHGHVLSIVALQPLHNPALTKLAQCWSEEQPPAWESHSIS